MQRTGRLSTPRPVRLRRSLIARGILGFFFLILVGAAARNPAPTYMMGGAANAALINFTKRSPISARATACWSPACRRGR